MGIRSVLISTLFVTLVLTGIQKATTLKCKSCIPTKEVDCSVATNVQEEECAVKITTAAAAESTTAAAALVERQEASTEGAATTAAVTFKCVSYMMTIEGEDKKKLALGCAANCSNLEECKECDEDLCNNLSIRIQPATWILGFVALICVALEY